MLQLSTAAAATAECCDARAWVHSPHLSAYHWRPVHSSCVLQAAVTAERCDLCAWVLFPTPCHSFKQAVPSNLTIEAATSEAHSGLVEEMCAMHALLIQLSDLSNTKQQVRKKVLPAVTCAAWLLVHMRAAAGGAAVPACELSRPQAMLSLCGMLQAPYAHGTPSRACRMPRCPGLPPTFWSSSTHWSRPCGRRRVPGVASGGGCCISLLRGS